MQSVTFVSAGTRCAGDLYLPDGFPARAPYPGLVLGHGFSIIKQSLQGEAEYFRRAGYVVLAIDYRTFGTSEGEPRGQLFPLHEVEDLRNAISFLQAQPHLDGEAIGIWGASFGGAVVIYTAAVDRRVKAVVASVPIVNGRRWMRALRTSAQWDTLLDRLEADRQQRYETGQSARIPATGRSRSAALPLADRTIETFQTMAERLGRPLVVSDPEITLESVERILEFNPESVIHQIGPRALCIVTTAGWDVVHLLEHIQDAYKKAVEPKQLVLLPYAELDFYFEPGKSDGLAHALAWFQRYIPARS